MAEQLVVNEIYLSLQGESTFAGLPCVFIRLTGCNLRCSYCDTAYAFAQGAPRSIDSILEEVTRLAGPFESSAAAAANRRLPLVELTGGEPLLQKSALPLMRRLCDLGFTVLIETSGALDIGGIDPRVRRIMDLKCPSSGESHRNRIENLRLLRPTDEIKFVIATREDYEWARAQISGLRLAEICPILVSWAAPLRAHQREASLKPAPPAAVCLTKQQLAEAVVADCLPVRFQLQLHKYVWPPDQRGV